VVSYAFDPVTGQGYVYLPGRNDKNYRLNVHTIIRRVEGKWFYSWTKWDAVAEQLIESRRRPQSLTSASGANPQGRFVYFRPIELLEQNSYSYLELR
jgi:hypothetical protein